LASIDKDNIVDLIKNQIQTLNDANRALTDKINPLVALVRDIDSASTGVDSIKKEDIETVAHIASSSIEVLGFNATDMASKDKSTIKNLLQKGLDKKVDEKLEEAKKTQSIDPSGLQKTIGDLAKVVQENNKINILDKKGGSGSLEIDTDQLKKVTTHYAAFTKAFEIDLSAIDQKQIKEKTEQAIEKKEQEIILV
jgi:hypothetical protein